MFKRAETLHPQCKPERLSPQTTTLEILIDRAVFIGLQREAQVRETTTTRLASDLLEAAITDRLTAAILDR